MPVDSARLICFFKDDVHRETDFFCALTARASQVGRNSDRNEFVGDSLLGCERDKRVQKNAEY